MFDTNYTKLERQIKCDDDCIQSGCPGHQLELRIFSTAGVGSIYKDNILMYTLDRAEAKAVWEMLDFLKNNG